MTLAAYHPLWFIAACIALGMALGAALAVIADALNRSLCV